VQLFQLVDGRLKQIETVFVNLLKLFFFVNDAEKTEAVFLVVCDTSMNQL